MSHKPVAYVLTVCLALLGWGTWQDANASSKHKRRRKAPPPEAAPVPPAERDEAQDPEPPLLDARADSPADAAEDADVLVTQKKARRPRKKQPRVQEVGEPNNSHRRGGGRIFIALSAGSGTGWHPGRVLEGNTALQTSAGYANAGLVLNPELGWQITRGFALSIAGRQQLVEPGQWQATEASPAPKIANAAFLKATWSVGQGNAVWLISAMAGGGDGFRLKVPQRPNDGLTSNDTVRGGPFIFGPGLGFAYHFASSFAWFAEGRVLAGAPSFAVVAEASSGFALGL
ncbi:MAG: hypothetical protein SF187_07105 [Deltaproteobacteria bacterium]|nr:hypothetical protein [Deltaproteobacteria bacterium]